MKNHKCIGILALFALSIVRADAQQVHQAIASGGGDASGATGSVSYTIGQVSYTTASGSSGTSAAGIQIALNAGNPLPIELVRFEGRCTGEKVQLSWQTAAELNNDFFVAEKSKDGRNWTVLATIPGGKASKEYSCADEQPATPVAYYRLKQVDLDGTFSYSQVVHVVGCAGKAKAITLYPNPTATGVYLAADEVEGMEYELYDTRGALLRKGKMQNGTTYIDMSAWAAGTYFLKLRQNNSFINNFSIIKN
jgi:hypothetical protein